MFVQLTNALQLSFEKYNLAYGFFLLLSDVILFFTTYKNICLVLTKLLDYKQEEYNLQAYTSIQ